MTVPWLFSHMTKSTLFFQGSLWAAFPSADAESSPIWWCWSLLLVVNLTQSAINEEIRLGKNLWGHVQKGLMEGRDSFRVAAPISGWPRGKAVLLPACLPLLLAGERVCPCCCPPPHCYCGTSHWCQTAAFFRLPMFTEDQQLCRNLLGSKLDGLR